MTEYLYHVDEDDNVIGRATRREVRTKHLFHRTSAIIVLNSKGEILVHKRTATKDIFPGYHDMMVGGTVDYGETYDEGARRETQEEIGVKNAELQFLFKHTVISERVIFQVYRLIYDGPIDIQKEEIEYARFMTIQELRQLMKKEKYCPDTMELFDIYLKRYHEEK